MGRGLSLGAGLIAAVTAVGVMGAVAPSAYANPLAPTSVTALAGSDSGEVDLTWVKPSDSSGILGYLIQANTASGPVCEGAECPWVAGENTQTYTYSGLSDGTSYTFIVYAERASGFTASMASGAVTPFTVPDAPGIPVASRAGSGEVTLTWSTPSNNGGSTILSYTVSCVTGGCASVEDVSSPYVVTGLDPATEYTFAVVAVNDRGSSASSAPSNAVTPYGAPTTPTEVQATAGNAQATVTWTAASGNGRDLTGNTVVTAAASDTTCATPLGTTTVDGAATSATVTALTNDTTYRFCVYATTGTGDNALNSPYSTATSGVTPAGAAVVTAPDAPGAPVAEAGDGSATLTWTAPGSTGGQPIAAYTAVAVGDATKTCTTTSLDTNPLSCTIAGLTNYTAYTFTVTANNGAFDSVASAPSNEITPMQAGAAAPSAPTDLTVSFDGTSATLTWQQPSTVPELSRVTVTPIYSDGQTSTPQTPTDVSSSAGSLSIYVADLPVGDYLSFTVRVENLLGNAEATSDDFRYLSSDLPYTDGTVWPMCTTPTQVSCISAAEFVASGEPVSGAGLTAWVTTLGSYEGGPQSINWAIQGLSGNEDEMRLVVRTGGWRPRYTVARVTEMDLSAANDPQLGWTLTITGTPLRMDWAAGDDPLFTTCSAGYSPAPDCGDDTARANEVGSRWTFDGNTQDLGGSGWDGERDRLSGFFVSVDAQVGPFTNPLALVFYPPTATPAGWQVTVGNPHLDVNGEPVRGYLRAWLPAGYFTAQGTTPEAALAAGFTVTSTEGGRTELVTAELIAHNGGVMVTIPDFGYSVRTLAVLNAPAPDVPVLTAGVATANSVSFTFPTEEGVDYAYSYFVTGLECDECGLLESDVPIPVDGSTASVTVPNLPADADIHITVSADRGGVVVDSAELVMSTLPAPPAQPEAPTIGARTRSSVALTWLAPDDNGSTITDYEVQFRLASAVDWSTFSDGVGTSTSATVTGLTAGQTYVFRILAVNAGGPSEYSPASVSALAAVAPSTPAAPTIGARTGSSIAVSWTAPDNGGSAITDYVVQFRLASAVEWSTFADGVATSTSATVTGLTAGQTYVFRIAAVSAAGTSGSSLASTSARAAAAPAAPAPPTIGALTSSSVAISWTAPAANGSTITDYVVQFRLASAVDWSTFADGTGTGVSTTVTGLAASSRYVFRVAAVSDEGTSAYSSASAEAQTPSAVTPPTKPTLTAGATTGSTVVFTFTRVANHTYTAAASVGSTPVPAQRVKITFAGTTGTVTVSGLSGNQSVTVRVTARRSGIDVTSDPATAKTKVAVPSPATQVKMTVSSRKTPSVTWTRPASTGGAAVRYVVTIKDAQGKVVATSSSLTATTWTGTRALARGTYTASVVASNSAGKAAAANSAKVTVR